MVGNHRTMPARLHILAGEMATSAGVSERDGLRERLSRLMLRDEYRLRRRLDGLRGAPPHTLLAEVEEAERRVARRRDGVPELGYPEELPITARRDEIAAALRDHQVVIV